MATITQDMRYRLSLMRYAEKFDVTSASIKYKTSRQYIYRWKRRFDGSIEALRERSRWPHCHPNQHTPEEIKLILDMRRHNPDAGLVIFRVKLMQRKDNERFYATHSFHSFEDVIKYHLRVSTA